MGVGRNFEVQAKEHKRRARHWEWHPICRGMWVGLAVDFVHLFVFPWSRVSHLSVLPWSWISACVHVCDRGRDDPSQCQNKTQSSGLSVAAVSSYPQHLAVLKFVWSTRGEGGRGGVPQWQTVSLVLTVAALFREKGGGGGGRKNTHTCMHAHTHTHTNRPQVESCSKLYFSSIALPNLWSCNRGKVAYSDIPIPLVPF